MTAAGVAGTDHGAAMIDKVATTPSAPAGGAPGEAAAVDTAVAFLVFNRPDVTARVFRAIAAARPRTLLVVADGPRPGRPGEADRCAEVRRIATAVDWECDVRTNFAAANLGCKRRVSTGLDWAFAQAEEVIVLEDDCLPHPTFFPYCRELLARYRGDPRVAAVSGANFQFGRRRGGASYYFSRYPHIWGWASWRRAWAAYDVGMTAWPRLRADGWLAGLLGEPWKVAYYTRVFDAVYEGRLDTWDAQWLFACWTTGMVAALPQRNLISNIGFGPDATHTTAGALLAALPTWRMEFPLAHPPAVERHVAADDFTESSQFRGGSRLRRVPGRIRRLLYGLHGRLAARAGGRSA